MHIQQSRKIRQKYTKLLNYYNLKECLLCAKHRYFTYIISNSYANLQSKYFTIFQVRKLRLRG